MVNFGPLAAEIRSLVWGTPANFNGFRVLAALMHGTLSVGVSQTMRCWTEGATYIWQGGHHVGHCPHSSSFYLSSFYLFFLAYSQLSQIEHAAYFCTWCGHSANLGCRPKMCCMRLTENAGHKKSPKIRYLGTIAKLCRVISSQLRHKSAIGRKLLKQQYLLHVSSQYGELRAQPTSGWGQFGSLGHPSKFQWVSPLRVLASLLQRCRSMEVNQTLHDVSPSPGLVHYIYIFGELLPPNTILKCAQFILNPSLAFCYIGSVTARHSSSGHQPNCGIEQRAPPIFGTASITFGISQHLS